MTCDKLAITLSTSVAFRCFDDIDCNFDTSGILPVPHISIPLPGSAFSLTPPLTPPKSATPTQTFIDNPQYTTIRYVQIYNGIEYICVPLIDDNAADSYTECSP